MKKRGSRSNDADRDQIDRVIYFRRGLVHFILGAGCASLYQVWQTMRMSFVILRRNLLLAALGLSLALAIAMLVRGPDIIESIARAVQLIVKMPLALFFLVPLLVLTAAAGAWATVVGIRAHGKRIRIGRRRRYHH